jgi:hypothetical protein
LAGAIGCWERSWGDGTPPGDGAHGLGDHPSTHFFAFAKTPAQERRFATAGRAQRARGFLIFLGEDFVGVADAGERGQRGEAAPANPEKIDFHRMVFSCINLRCIRALSRRFSKPPSLETKNQPNNTLQNPFA